MGSDPLPSDMVAWKQTDKPVGVVRLIRTTGAADQFTQVAKSKHNGSRAVNETCHDKLPRQFLQYPSEHKRLHPQVPVLLERRARY